MSFELITKELFNLITWERIFDEPHDDRSIDHVRACFALKLDRVKSVGMNVPQWEFK